MRPKIYIASKLAYASQFCGYREAWKKELNLHARWFEQAKHELTSIPTSEDFKIYWRVDEEDVKEADALLVYAAEKDKLRGALIEAGIAIGAGKLVIVIGEHPDYGTWQNHPCVVKADSFETAKKMLLRRFRCSSES